MTPLSTNGMAVSPWQTLTGAAEPRLGRVSRRLLLGRALDDHVLRCVTAASFIAIAVETHGGRIARKIELLVVGRRHRAGHVRIHAVLLVDVHAAGDAPRAVRLRIEIERDAPRLQIEFVAVECAAL